MASWARFRRQSRTAAQLIPSFQSVLSPAKASRIVHSPRSPALLPQGRRASRADRACRLMAVDASFPSLVSAGIIQRAGSTSPLWDAQGGKGEYGAAPLILF